MGIIGLVSLLGIMLVQLKSKTDLKANNKAIAIQKKKTSQKVKVTRPADEEMHYRAHPYARQAEAMNNADLYDSAIYYYRVAASKFEKDQEWRGYVWATNYVARLYLFAHNQNYVHALPFLKKALAQEKALGQDHPFIGATYFYWGFYYDKEKQAGRALKMYTKSLAIRLKNYGEKCSQR